MFNYCDAILNGYAFVMDTISDATSAANEKGSERKDRTGAQLGMDVGLRWEPNQRIGERPDGDRSWRCFDWPLLGTLRSLRRVINRGCDLRWK